MYGSPFRSWYAPFFSLPRAGTGRCSRLPDTDVPLTRETHCDDREGAPGTIYRLFAVNGLGDELLLGEVSTHAEVTIACAKEAS